MGLEFDHTVRPVEPARMMLGRPVVAALAAGLLIAGCATSPASAPAPTDVPGGPDVSALPPCEEQPSPPALPEVPGLTLPEEAVVFFVQEVGTLTQVQGVVELQPVDVRAYYEGRDDLDVLAVEDEVFEAEILFSDGTWRTFVKAQVLCATGSNFTATVGSEEDAAAVPTPAGTPQPPD